MAQPVLSRPAFSRGAQLPLMLGSAVRLRTARPQPQRQRRLRADPGVCPHCAGPLGAHGALSVCVICGYRVEANSVNKRRGKRRPRRVR